jgi:hypothetical protein
MARMIQSTEGASVRRYEGKTAGMVGKLHGTYTTGSELPVDGGMTQL